MLEIGEVQSPKNQKYGELMGVYPNAVLVVFFQRANNSSQQGLAIFMQLPTWIKPALTGAAIGAVATATVGFGWGGWVTGGSAQDMAAKQSDIAIVSALTPYCVQRSQSDISAATVLAELSAASGMGRRTVIEKSGWATPLGSETPNRALAQACQLALASAD